MTLHHQAPQRVACFRRRRKHGDARRVTPCYPGHEGMTTACAASRRVRGLRYGAPVLLAVVLATVAGCSQVTWRVGLGPALKPAERENRLVLVYYWQAFNKDCQRMDRTVFRDKDVAAQIKTMIPVKLDATLERGWGDELGLRGVPSFLVISPSGEYLRRGAGLMDVDQFLAFLVVAKLST